MSTRFTEDSRGVVFDVKDGLLWGKSPDCTTAQKEGWDLFCRSDTGEFEIERLSDPEEVGCQEEDCIGDNDEEVIDVLINRAMAGERMPMLAIWLEGRRLEKHAEIWVPTRLIHTAVLGQIKTDNEQDGCRRDVFETIKKIRAVLNREIDICIDYNATQKHLPRSQRRKKEPRFLKGNLRLLKEIENELLRDNTMVPADQWYYLITKLFDENEENGVLITADFGKRLMGIVMGIQQ